MKKNLLTKIILPCALAMCTVISSQAQRRIRNADDLQKYQQLKDYVDSHPVPAGQTNAAIYMLQQYGDVPATKDFLKAASTERTRSTANTTALVPVNDDCANATALTEELSCVTTQGDVAAATESMPAGTCGIFTSTTGYDVWFQFVAVTVNPSITVTGSASFDAVVFLFDACGGTVLGCADATYGGGTEVLSSTGLTPGNTYYIRVYSYGTVLPVTTTFDICVHGAPPPPANDDCANAITLTENATCVTTQGDVGGATESMPSDSCNGYISANGFDVWYQFVAVTASPFISVTGSASFDPVVFLFDACGGNMLGCADASASGGIEVIPASGLTPGNTYYVRVYDYGNALPTTTTFDICVFSPPTPPANDACASSTTLTMNPGCIPVSATLGGATDDGIIGCAGTADDDVWFSFVATTANARITVTSTETFNTVFEVFDACGGTSLFCIDYQSGGNETVDIPVTPSSTYFIRVYTYDVGGAVPGNFDICVQEVPPPPANDNCSGAIEIIPVATEDDCNSNTLVVTDNSTPSVEAISCSSANYFDDVWYYFVATSDSMTVNAFNISAGVESAGGIGYALYDGCGGTELFCENDGIGTVTTTFTGLTPGNTYYLRTFTASSLAAGSWNMCVFGGLFTGIHTQYTSGNVQVFPNPTTGRIEVLIPQNSARTTVNVIDVLGNVLKTEIMANINRKIIDLSAFANGIYFVKVENEKGVSTQKITLSK